MIDAAEVMESHFDALAESMAGVDLAGIEDAAWQLLIEIESLDKRLAPLPDTGPDFMQCQTPRELADNARRHVDRLDSHLIQHQRAQAAIGALLGAFEDAFSAGQQAEYIIREIDRQMLTLETQK
jgi:hypothetical protein